MAWWVVPAVMAAVGYVTARKAQKAQNVASDRYAEIERELAAPYVAAAEWALPQRQEAIETYLAPMVGKPSGLGEALSITKRGIRRAGVAARRDVGRAYRGVPSRALGALARIRQKEQEKLGEAEFTHRQLEHAYRRQNVGLLLDALSGQARLGQAGLAPAMAGAQAPLMKGQAAMGTFGSVAGGIGGIGGAYQGQQEQAWLEEQLAKLRKTYGSS